MARERISREELTRRTMLKGIETLLATNVAFRRFLWTFFRDVRIFDTTYSRGSEVDTAYLAGRRDAGLEVLHMLRAIRPDILGLLEQEGNAMTEAARPLQSEDTDDQQLPNAEDPDADDGDPDVLP